MSIKVLLVDDQVVFRKGVLATIVAFPGIEVTGEASSAAEALEMVELLRPDLVLTELNLPGMNGIQLTRRIKERFPEMRVLVLTDSDAAFHLFAAISAGADGYLLKSILPVELARAILDAARGYAPISPTVSRQCLTEFRRVNGAPEPPRRELSAREIQLLQLANQGKAYKEIAQELSLTEGTIKNCMYRLLQKLQVRNRAEAVTYAVQRGLIERASAS